MCIGEEHSGPHPFSSPLNLLSFPLLSLPPEKLDGRDVAPSHLCTNVCTCLFWVFFNVSCRVPSQHHPLSLFSYHFITYVTISSHACFIISIIGCGLGVTYVNIVYTITYHTHLRCHSTTHSLTYCHTILCITRISFFNTVPLFESGCDH